MTKRRRGTQPNLSAERVRTTALRLIEEEGLDQFSTRKLGRALGVEAMAIYWYYPSKEALLDAVVDLLFSKLDARLPDEASNVDWIDALRKLAHAYRALAHQYPNAFALLATRRFATEGTYAFLDALFTLARREGLDDRTTARWFRLVSSYCSGVALDEIAGHREAQSDQKDEQLRAKFPRLVAVSEHLAPAHFDDIFAFGLEVLLDGLAHAAGRRDGSVGSRTKAR